MLAGHGPSPDIRFPLPGIQRLGFLKQFERLLAIAWWDWDAEKVTRNVRAICSAEVGPLERAN
jgi:hypothetical protein